MRFLGGGNFRLSTSKDKNFEHPSKKLPLIKYGQLFHAELSTRLSDH